MGRFPKGHHFYRWASNKGVIRSYPNPNELWKACVDYFQHVENNPIEKPIIARGRVMDDTEKIPRAMSIAGLCFHIGMSLTTWRKLNEREDPRFAEIQEYVTEIIRTQKFELAAAGLLNANIISRDLELAERVTVDGGLTPWESITAGTDDPDDA